MSTLRFHDDSDARFERARGAVQRGDLAGAVTIYVEEPEDSAVRSGALASAAQLQMHLGNWDEGERLGREAITFAATRGHANPAAVVMAYRTVGDCMTERGRFADATGLYNEALGYADAMEAKRDELGPDAFRAVRLERAHTLNSIGGSQLKAMEPLRAITPLEAARRVHADVGDPSMVGYSEVLTHLGVAYASIGDVERARYLLDEALEVAETRGDGSQADRVRAATGRLPGATEEDRRKIARSMVEAAQKAENAGLIPTAYLRWCISADHALHDLGDLPMAGEAVAAARRLEAHLHAGDPNRPALRLTEAYLRRRAGDEDGAFDIILRGAAEWFDLLGRAAVPADVEQITRRMHEHFLLLTAMLLARRRPEEALCAFELGRGLTHAIEARSANAAEVRGVAGFGDGHVSTEVLTRVRGQLSDDAVLLSFAILPRAAVGGAARVVAFVIGHNAIDVVEAAVLEDYAAFGEALNAMPQALHDMEGENAIPEAIRVLAANASSAIGARKVEAFLPHSLLHIVPWRVLLRRAGVPWGRLAAMTEFGLMGRALMGPPVPGVPLAAVALGHGESSKGKDFADEALEFAIAWDETRARVEVATCPAVRDALGTSDLVHLSCHGIGIADDLRLLLSDGSFSVDEILTGETVVAPVVLLSACFSGTYFVRYGDYPVGAAPHLLRLGARAVLATRFPIDTRFAARLLPELGRRLGKGQPLPEAFVDALAAVEVGADVWSDLACVELLAS